MPTTTFGWAAGDAAYAMGTYELADDQALVIRGRSPECAFWNLCLWNPFLHIYNADYDRVTINGGQVQYEDDGSWTIVVSARDPGPSQLDRHPGPPAGTALVPLVLPGGDAGAPDRRGRSRSRGRPVSVCASGSGLRRRRVRRERRTSTVPGECRAGTDAASPATSPPVNGSVLACSVFAATVVVAVRVHRRSRRVRDSRPPSQLPRGARWRHDDRGTGDSAERLVGAAAHRRPPCRSDLRNLLRFAPIWRVDPGGAARDRERSQIRRGGSGICENCPAVAHGRRATRLCGGAVTTRP